MSAINRGEVDFVLAVLQVIGIITYEQRADAWEKMSKIPEGIPLAKATDLLLENTKVKEGA